MIPQNELVALTAEAHLLGEQLDALRLKHKHPSVGEDAAAWHEKAIVQRHKRRQAEDANEQLRRALFLQGGFLRNLKTEFAKSVPGSIQLNMRNFLHTALHLREDPQSRARDLETACTDSKLDMAIQILLDETETIQPFTTPKFSWQQLDLGAAGLGMTTIAVYAFDSKNACETFKAACNAIVGCGVTWPNYSLVKASVELVELPPTKFDIRYGVTQHLYQSDSSDGQVLLEGREITYYRVGDKYGVFLWDYVDADDVHPPEKTTAVSSCRVGA
ncbi:hypothetical protein BBJ28_00025598 [Nothophytophthora sp. Chile5]|nr:hypothetical protein BBJ28_00025598 [Nothophytophthora sp. Chile5]